MRPAFIVIAGTAGLVAALLILSGPAWAQANRTFVSGSGSDVNPCSLSAPCRSFARAATQTNAGGEITVLDSAGYGPVTLTQSITITNPSGVEAGITAPVSASAITISTPTIANITLRGLTLEGGGVGATGVNVLSNLPAGNATPSTLNIIDCVIKDFVGNGVAIQPEAVGGGGTSNLHAVIADSAMLNNAGNGIIVSTQTVNINPSIYRTIVSGNTVGIALVSGVGLNAVLVNSNVDNNATMELLFQVRLI